MVNVIVSPEDLAGVFFDGSVYVVPGTTESSGAEVTFIGEHRLTSELLHAVKDSGLAQIAEVPEYAIRRRTQLRKRS